MKSLIALIGNDARDGMPPATGIKYREKVSHLHLSPRSILTGRGGATVQCT